MNYRFHGLELNTHRQELMAAGVPLAIPPKALSVLLYLIENRDRMVTKVELLDRFWALQVSEAALQTTISVVRKAVAEHSGSAPFIKTHHGRGFRFVAPVEQDHDLPAQDAGPPAGQNLNEQRWIAILTLRLKAGADQGEHHQPLLSSLIAEAEAQVSAAKGRLLHMMLDGFSASFGVDPHLEDATRLALTCAHRIMALDQVAKLRKAGFKVSIGVHNGAALLDSAQDASGWKLPGGLERGSAELADLGDNGEVIVSASILGLMRDEIETTPLGGGHRLLRAPKERAGLPARPLKRPTTFVGRNAEMSFLRTSLERIDASHSEAITLSGPAGIGKSRLVLEFLADLDAQTVAHHRYFCLPRFSETPMAVIRAMCIDLCTDDHLATLCDPVDAALLASLLEETARPPALLEGLSEYRKQQRLQALVGKVLRDAAARQKRVLVFEDIHWIDGTSRRLLDALLRGALPHNLMVIFTTRPSQMPALTESLLQLAPLGQADSLALLQEIPELSRVDAAIVETLAQRAGGNPFFLEELALATQVGADPARDLPDTVQAVIEVRIAELEDALRMTVFVISVIGQPAAPALISHLLDRLQDDTEQALDRLVRMGFLQEAETGFVFRHMLLLDTAYAMLVPQDRRMLHGKIAAFLETETPASPTRPETLAWHFQEAGNRLKAIEYWTKASYAALTRSAQQEAALFSERGLALIDTEEPDSAGQEMRLQLFRAQALMAMKGYGAQEVGQVFRRVHDLSRTTGDFKTQARALVGLWVHTWVRGQLSQSLDHAQNLLEMARQSGDLSLLVQGHGGLGEVMTHTGKLNAAMPHLVEGLKVVGDEYPDSITAQNATVTCAAYAAWVSAMQGRLEDMRTYCDLSARLSQKFENRFAEAIHLALCSEAQMFAGDVQACLDLASQTVDLSDEHDFPFWLGTGLVMRGWALGQLGEGQTGIDTLNRGIAVFERSGADIQLPNWYGLKAETLLHAGKLAEARDAAQHALACAQRTGDVWFTPRIHVVLAHVLAAENDASGSEALLAKVAQMAEAEALSPVFVTLRSPKG